MALPPAVRNTLWGAGKAISTLFFLSITFTAFYLAIYAIFTVEPTLNLKVLPTPSALFFIPLVIFLITRIIILLSGARFIPRLLYSIVMTPGGAFIRLPLLFIWSRPHGHYLVRMSHFLRNCVYYFQVNDLVGPLDNSWPALASEDLLPQLNGTSPNTKVFDEEKLAQCRRDYPEIEPMMAKYGAALVWITIILTVSDAFLRIYVGLTFWEAVWCVLWKYWRTRKTPVVGERAAGKGVYVDEEKIPLAAKEKKVVENVENVNEPPPHAPLMIGFGLFSIPRFVKGLN
ncbi:hypothetical protein B0H66DRAFT_268192 [Apodospora peruviana]|uniref:Uncharacterized protein n=1 Tax=Apodospora peruviana TaxID=516989 RepID=A0AAE0I6H7_9PEZI|nr:hypothetical protein B0H66DRAFT_268192 [Apodospora peruviana]